MRWACFHQQIKALGKAQRARASALLPALTSGASNDRRNIKGPGPTRHQRMGNLQRLQQLHAAFQVLQPCASACAHRARLLHVRKLPCHLAIHEDDAHASPITAANIMLNITCVMAHLECSLLVVSDLGQLMQCTLSLAFSSRWQLAPSAPSAAAAQGPKPPATRHPGVPDARRQGSTAPPAGMFVSHYL